MRLTANYASYGSATVRSIDIVIGTDFDDVIRGDDRATPSVDTGAQTR